MGTDRKMTFAEIEVRLDKEVKKIFIQTQEDGGGNDGFSLALSDGSNVWEGEVSEDDLTNFSTKRKMDFDTYLEQTRAALTQDFDRGDLCFEYHLTTKGEGGAQFVWKKHSVEDDVKFQLGSVKMTKSDRPGQKVCELLSGCVVRTNQLKGEITALRSDNERLSMERQNALKRLDKCVTAKEALEADLYSKFAVVLNSKKEQIRLLKEKKPQLQSDTEDEASPSTSRVPVTPVNNGQQRGSKTEDRKRSHHEPDDMDTDEEQSSGQKQKKSEPERPARQSPRLTDSSLNLGDDESFTAEDKAPTVRRRRRQASTRKETPAKPVLPRVTSGSSNSRISRSGSKPSLRKSGSENSNKSSDNLDPDDLLEGI